MQPSRPNTGQRVRASPCTVPCAAPSPAPHNRDLFKIKVPLAAGPQLLNPGQYQFSFRFIVPVMSRSVWHTSACQRWLHQM